MSQPNNPYNPGPRLPHGPVTEWVMEDLSDEVLEHELALSYEVLHDIHCSMPPYNGGVAIRGMLKELADDTPKSRDPQYRSAVEVWKKRLQRAQDELERRYLLS